MFLTEPVLSCLCCVFGVIVMLEDTSHDPSSMLLLREGGCWQNVSIHGPIHPVVLSPLQKSTPKAWCFHPMLHGWDGVLGIVLILLLPPNAASGVYTKKLYFGLIWPHDLLPCLLWIIQMVFDKLQTCAGLDMCWLKQGDLARTAGF